MRFVLGLVSTDCSSVVFFVCLAAMARETHGLMIGRQPEQRVSGACHWNDVVNTFSDRVFRTLSAFTERVLCQIRPGVLLPAASVAASVSCAAALFRLITLPSRAGRHYCDRK